MSYEDLSKHGVEIRKNEFGEGDRVRYVRLDWPAEWWADVLNKHGEFLPMCCANLSAIRDNLTTALREGGWIECEDLAECLAYMGGHGWDDYLQDNGCPMPDPIEDPMLDLIWKWRLVEDVAHLTIRPRPLDPTNLKDAVRAVHGFAWKLWQDALFANGPDACPNLQNKAERRIVLSRFIPAIRTLYHHLQEKDLGEAEGIALVLRDRPDEPIETIGGPAIYRDMQDAAQAIHHWPDEIADNLQSRPVRVTLEEGLEFLD